MSFFKKLKDGISEATDSATTAVNNLRNQSLLDASTAVSAMIAAADGTIDDSEKQKMLAFFKTNDSLKSYEKNDVEEAFNKWIEQINVDVDAARANMLSSIGKHKDEEAVARFLIRLACAIGEADGDFDDDEKSVATEIATELGLDPSEFIK